MLEITGVSSRGYNRKEIAAILRTSQYKVDQMLSTAKAKVEARLESAESEDE